MRILSLWERSAWRALEEVDIFVRAMPSGKEGIAFLKGSEPVQPDPESFGSYVEHAGRRRGHWPSSSEIGSAMLDADRDKAKP